MHCDEYVYTGTPDTLLYKLIDALCGTTGAGALVNEIFLARMGAAMQTIYFNELDYIFGKVSFLARSPAESYTYNPMVDQLTTDQWDEVRVKDSWYRARITDFFKACQLGGTPDGLRMAILAALAVDCDIYEVWRYEDNFGITANLGRAPVPARNEVVVRPHKSELAPEEMRLARDMLDKISPMESVITVNPEGLAVLGPVTVNAAASDSEYYEVQKLVTATPVLNQLPPPEMLPIDLLPSETWLYDAKKNPTLAPYAAFNISAEYGYYYLMGGGSRSPIDSVTYGTIEKVLPTAVTVYEVSGSQVSLTFSDAVSSLLTERMQDFIDDLGTLNISPGSLAFPTLNPGPSHSYFRDNLDPVNFNYVGVPWSSPIYPLATSITATTNTLVSMIHNTPGMFVLVGTSEGAIVTSNVYDQLRSGVLADRRKDFLAGITFANPRRQGGHAFPGGTDPGGHGAYPSQLINSAANWWDFAAPNDPVAATGDDPEVGAWEQTWFNNLLTSYTGTPTPALLGTAPPDNTMTILNTIRRFYLALPGGIYGGYKPIAGDARPAYQVALDYIASFAGVPAALATNDPMSTYRGENNFAVFDTTGQYTSPTPYEKADSPDNFPGGKYGVHPTYAPALNPDGSNYIFAYASQAAYVTVKSAQVQAIGGLATPDTYQLPISAQSSSAQVFTPDQAIAYFPPAKDSTVSTSLTRRRNSNQVTTEVRDPVNFVRSS